MILKASIVMGIIYIWETGSKSDCMKMYKYKRIQGLKMILFIV